MYGDVATFSILSFDVVFASLIDIYVALNVCMFEATLKNKVQLCPPVTGHSDVFGLIAEEAIVILRSKWCPICTGIILIIRF